MVDTVNRKCPCGKQCSFGFVGDIRPTACSACKNVDMVDMRSRKCPCGKVPAFALAGDARPTACFACKNVDMIHIKSRKCPCGKQPVFGSVGDARPTACSACKSSDMVDIVTRKCPCGKQCSFGFVGDVRPTACSACKSVGMVDMKSARCESPACAVYASHERGYVQYRVHGARLCASCCQSQYPDIARRGLSMRTELLVIAELERLVPELDESFAVLWDCPPNCSTRLAPDRIWYFRFGDRVDALHLEVDESGKEHEDDDARVAEIHGGDEAGASWLVRFNPGPSADGRPACVRRKVTADGDKKYERADGPEWDHRMRALAEVVRDRCGKMRQGREPTAEDWKVKLFF